MRKRSKTGAIGALLDEYWRAIRELIQVIEKIPDEALTIITDPYTDDEACRSVQTILSHVVYSGYGYAVSIRNVKTPGFTRPDSVLRSTMMEYIKDLTSLYFFTEDVFKEIDNSELEQHNEALKIMTRWGQSYDIEQLTEHAIVHILRHRRQIENVMPLLLKQESTDVHPK